MLNIDSDKTLDMNTGKPWWKRCMSVTIHVLSSHAQLSNTLISSPEQIGGLWLENRQLQCVQDNVDNAGILKKIIPQWVSWIYIYQDLLKLTVSWIKASPMTRYGVTTIRQNQNDGLRNSDMWIPPQRNSWRCKQTEVH